jgi:hypothetical protein
MTAGPGGRVPRSAAHWPSFFSSRKRAGRCWRWPPITTTWRIVPSASARQMPRPDVSRLIEADAHREAQTARGRCWKSSEFDTSPAGGPQYLLRKGSRLSLPAKKRTRHAPSQAPCEHGLPSAAKRPFTSRPPMVQSMELAAIYDRSCLPACSATMYAAYQAGQSASRWPRRFSCSPCAASARRSALAKSAVDANAVSAASIRPGSRVVTSCSNQLLPSGSLKVANEPYVA